MKVAFQNRLIIIGFGSIGQGLLPLLFRHLAIRAEQITVVTADERGVPQAKHHGIDFLIAPLNRDNYRAILEPLVKAGDFLVNVSVNVSSVALLEFCQERNALYLDTSIEPWAGGYSDHQYSVSSRSMYALRENALSLRSRYRHGPTALLAHGANPGLVSHFVKEALMEVACASESNAQVPVSSMEWAKLAQHLGVKTIHISERDTQRSNIKRVASEFVNTWSTTGFHVESLLPAELALGQPRRTVAGRCLRA